MTSRRASLDVTRAIALIGVVALNYHGYLNGAEAFRPTDDGLLNRMFSPLTGILTTRFAGTFVFVAGIGIALFMAAASDGREISRRRLVLLRRGALLLGVGAIVQWIWPGTILFYYGAYFIIGAAIARWQTRTLVTLAVAVTALSATIAGWRDTRLLAGDPLRWLSPLPDSPRNLLIRIFIDYTHPVFPWIVLVIAGIILGRHLDTFASFRNRLMGIGLAALVAAHVVRSVAWPSPTATTADVVRRAIVSTDPYDRSVGWVVSTLAVAVLAFCIVSVVTERYPESGALTALGNVGSMSLTLYFGHVFFYNVLVRQLGLLGPDGLTAALLLTLLYVVPAFVFASWWKSTYGIGPAERVYRLIGG